MVRFETVAVDGLQRFARYAYPPNRLGFCGSDEARTLLEYVAAGASDPDLARLAATFAGPLPYLTVMAAAAGIRDPFDPRVVEAYWLGNELLDRVDVRSFARVLDDGFRGRMGGGWGPFSEVIPVGGVPHHSFHVFAVYPWVGLLGSDHGPALEVLDRCRIRSGTVLEVMGDRVVVSSRPLEYADRRLLLGESRPETVVLGERGLRLAGAVSVGDTVSMHWDWVCERIDPGQAGRLHRYTARHLEIVNDRLDHSGPTIALEDGQ